MKPKLISLIGLALVCLVLAGFAQRGSQAGTSAVGSGAATSAGGRYVLSGAASQAEAGTLNGGRYRLSGLPQSRVQDLASGGKYRLAAENAPGGSEDGCCCMFLPCVRK